MASFLKKLFASANDRQVARINKKALKVDALAEAYTAMSDEELKGVTDKLKERLKNGENLENVLPDAYAAVREAATRVLHMRHYFVQIIGGICLHQGRIAEMATGEGKTLVATMPAYLNALSGDGVHIVTVNDYLARRDAEWMGKIYKFLGLTVGVIVPQMSFQAKRQAYAADITYCTNSELGFDFLRDNMALHKEDKVQRSLNFAIVDEVDSILVDEARTPLIISGRGDKSSDLYVSANKFAKTLKEDEDFTIAWKEKTVSLTEEGIAKAEKYFKIENLADIEHTELNHHINIALKAHHLMKRDGDYMVSDGQVVIVDENTGRIMVGRRYSDGLHQAIEAKENVRINSENRTVATITYQNFFRMYKKLSGMTGTAKTEEDEFRDIYNIDVVVLPTNLPSQRKDEHDRIYTTVRGKLAAVVTEIEECYASGQPVLVGTVSVEKSEELAKMLHVRRIPHNVLNAKNHEHEAEIVAQAGKFKTVTIATNMAGRGTDIMLGGNPEFQAKAKMEKDGYPKEVIENITAFINLTDPKDKEARAEYERHLQAFSETCAAEKEEVKELGGLRIIGTERHESRRIDNQLRGRAGRQGDPGSTVFFISLEDDIAKHFGGDRLKAIVEGMHLDADTPIASGIITKQIESAQRRVEGRNFSIRKTVLSYDDVMNIQRELIYKERTKVLDGLPVHEQILKMIPPIAQEIIAHYADYNVDYHDWDYAEFNSALEDKLLPEGTEIITSELAACYDVYKLKEAVVNRAIEEYEKKVALLKEVGFDFDDFERVVLLQRVDSKWVDHLSSIEALRQGIGLRGYGQQDPVVAYRKEAFDMFEEMIERIHSETVQILIKIKFEITENEKGEKEVVTGKKAAAKPKRKPSMSLKSVGRNDPCPCGSGMKYKNCCGK
ncbi:MAG: preprotein translocase subunit SecA [Clostridiaceae bacterium]|jgi:preprotein translocase subunit SecA|nr:preprotein translocase subunit SecA [Clostridiaceae bacterium]